MSKEIVRANSGENEGQEVVIGEIRKQVQAELETLSTKVPNYEDLSAEEKAIVDKYIASIDVTDLGTIDKFGQEAAKKIHEESVTLMGSIRTHDIGLEDMFVDLMQTIDENSEPKEPDESFLETFSKSPVKAIRRLAGKPKELATEARYRRSMVLTNLDRVQEKLETIRNELRVNAGKLGIMAQYSLEQYMDIQYQMVALTEAKKRIKEEQGAQNKADGKSLMQIDRNLQLRGAEDKIGRKIDNLMGTAVSAATKTIMARLLASQNEELSSDYDQDILTLLPEFEGALVMDVATDSLMRAVDTHNQLVEKVNETLRYESERSVEALQKVQEISRGSAIENETARVLTSNVIEAVRTIKSAQDKGRQSNEAFATILEEFTAELSKELKIGEESTPQIEGGSESASLEDGEER